MASSIPTISMPDGFVPPTPAVGAGASMPSLPALPALPSYLTGSNQGVGTGTDGSTAGATVNGLTSGQLSNNQATGGTGSTSTPVAGTGIWAQLGEWLKSIALPGTVSLVGLLLIILSVYIAATRGK